MNVINDLVVKQPMLHAANIYGRFTGIYFLSSLVVKFDRYGQPYAGIKLSDVLTSIQVNCFLPHALTMLTEPNIPVRVDISVSKLNGNFCYKCDAIEVVAFEDFAEELGIYGLPLAVLNFQGIHKRLYNILEHIHSVELLNFLSKSLLQPKICMNYCLCPGSLNHHHNYMGGLIEHSIEVAESVLNDESLTDSEKQIGIVAALIHDIGKTKTLTPDLNRTTLGYFVDHDSLNLEICASAMTYLETLRENDAVQLRHALTCNASGARYGFKAKTRLAVALKLFDGRSAKQSHIQLCYNSSTAQQTNATNYTNY
jgi:3'-5' exoribonuclease